MQADCLAEVNARNETPARRRTGLVRDEVWNTRVGKSHKGEAIQRNATAKRVKRKPRPDLGADRGQTWELGGLRTFTLRTLIQADCLFRVNARNERPRLTRVKTH